MKKNIVLLFLLALTSCATKKDIVYFNNVTNSQESGLPYNVARIQVNDILYIKVSAMDQEAIEPFNILNTNTNNPNLSMLKLQGYLVSPDGDIVFPIIGTVNVAGKTTVEVQTLLKRLLIENKYLLDPTVSVRVINSKITVLGEVTSPGTYDFSEQNITLPQALGYAGDLTIYGKRNILLIRQEGDQRIYVRLDLTDSKILNSPYYYVKQNDVIVVNPNYSKIKSSGIITNIGALFTVISLAFTTILLLRK